MRERIGPLKEKHRDIGQHYQIDLQTGVSGEKALSITWQKHSVPGSYVDLPRVYCLRSNQAQWPEEQLWRNYMMLTDLEAVFRCFKCDLRVRPIFHHKDKRADSHLFITVLAYQLVQLKGVASRYAQHNLPGSRWHEVDCRAKPLHQPETALVGGIREGQCAGKRGRYRYKESGRVVPLPQ